MFTKNFLLHVLKQTRKNNFLSLTGVNLTEVNEAYHKGLLKFDGEKIYVNSFNRLAIAVEAVNLGADFEKISRLLNWKEFEEFSSIILGYNGYMTFKRFIFKDMKNKKWEIDVLGVKEPIVLCLDCKGWQYGWYKSKVASVAEKHFERVKAFSSILPSLTSKLKIEKNKSFTVLPLIITLADTPYKSLNGSLIVPILRFKRFLYELPETLFAEFNLGIKTST
ncbi:MAG: hypothetical protein QXK81_02760 [Candidatus Bathyarchaeia archaeon]